MTFEEFLDELARMVAGADPEAVATVILVLTGLVTAIAVFSLICYLLTAIGFAKIFKKAGDKGWKAFIPIVNDYTRFKIAWDVKSFWVWFAAMVVMNIAPLFGESIVVSLVSLAACIVVIVYFVKLCLHIAKAFGRGKGTAALLFFFTSIMSLVLGFGKAEYVGRLRSGSESNAMEEEA